MPYAGTPSREPDTADGEAHLGQRSEVEELRDMFKQFMAKFEADTERSKADSASNAHVMGELASHVHTLSEKIKAQ